MALVTRDLVAQFVNTVACLQTDPLALQQGPFGLLKLSQGFAVVNAGPEFPAFGFREFFLILQHIVTDGQTDLKPSGLAAEPLLGQSPG